MSMSQKALAIATLATLVLAAETVAPAHSAGLSIGGTATHSCAILSNHQFKCWGDAKSGKLGQGHKDAVGDTPASMTGLAEVDVNMDKVTAVCTGADNTCALSDTGVVKCFGYGYQGQLGIGEQKIGVGGNPNDMGVYLKNVDLAGVATSISCGASHNCAVLEGGAAKCWGWGQQGQLGTQNGASIGNSPNDMGANLLPIDFGADVKISQIAAGDQHTCAQTDAGVVYCFGSNTNGRIAAGTPSASFLPNRVELPRPAKKIVAGKDHTCAILDNGKLYCWGLNSFGQLGTGNTVSIGATSPLAFAEANLGAGKAVKDVGVGEAHTCALLEGGCLKCFGKGADGRLGYGSKDDKPAQGDAHACVNVGPGTSTLVTALAVGKAHTCVIRALDKKTVCFGMSEDKPFYTGVLGRGDARPSVGIFPEDMPGELLAVQLGAQVRLDIGEGTYPEDPDVDNQNGENKDETKAPTSASEQHQKDQAVLVGVAVSGGVVLGLLLAAGVFALRRPKKAEQNDFDYKSRMSVMSVDAKSLPEEP